VLGTHGAARILLSIDQQDAEVLATKGKREILKSFEVACVAAQEGYSLSNCLSKVDSVPGAAQAYRTRRD
jgi:hypothetical protein